MPWSLEPNKMQDIASSRKSTCHCVLFGFQIKKLDYVRELNENYDQSLESHGSWKYEKFKKSHYGLFQYFTFSTWASPKMQQIIKQVRPSRQIFKTINFTFMKIVDFLVKKSFFRHFCFSLVIRITNYGRKSSSVVIS